MLLTLCLTAALAAPAAVQSLADSRPGICDVRGAFDLTAPAGSPATSVLVPLVLERPEQVPLAYEFTVVPSAWVRDLHVRTEAGNPIVDLALVPDPAGGTVSITWRAVVLAPPRDFSGVPRKAPIPREWPEEARPWVAATRYAQADAPEIAAAAADLAGRSKDVLDLVDRTLRRAGEIYGKQVGRCRELGAVEALTAQGSCTSCANLVAALLRANHIPARIVAGYATWYGPHQTHYLVEAYVPKFGWYPVESTLREAGWQPFRQIQFAVVPIEHEGVRALARKFSGGGVPYLSLTELPEQPSGWTFHGTVDASKNADHVATCAHAITDPRKQWDAALERGRETWMAWIAGVSEKDPKRIGLATKLRPEFVLKECSTLRDCVRVLER